MNYNEWQEKINEIRNENSEQTAKTPEEINKAEAADVQETVQNQTEPVQPEMTEQRAWNQMQPENPAQSDEAQQSTFDQTRAETAQQSAFDQAQIETPAQGAADGQSAYSQPQTETTVQDPAAGQGTSHQAAQKTAAEQNPQESVTYSWVNPKLQTGRNANAGQSSFNNSDYQWRDDRSYGGQNTQQTGGQQSSYNQTGSYQSSSDQAGSGQSSNRQGSSFQNGSGSNSGRTAASGAKRNRRVKQSKPGRKVFSGNSWMRTIAMALVFGLVAGSVMFGVNRAGNAIFGGNQTKTDVSTSQSFTRVATTTTTDGNSSLSDSLDDTTRTEGDASSAGTVAEVAANAMPSLVTISTMSVQEMQSFFGGTQQYEVEGAGTGVIVGQNDTELLIATNNHVIDGATEVTVGFVDEQVVEAFIKGTDPNNDLAVVGVKLSEIPQETMDQIKIIAIGNSDDLVLGEQVVAIGNALGIGQSVTSGYISAFDRELELSDGVSTMVSSNLIQTDAAINAGNSGGALLNMRGELVGINEAKSSGSGSGASVDNVGYSIPISKAEPILQELMSLETKEKVAEEEKGYLGIRCADVNQETSERYNIPVGVYVREIADDSPAADAGLIVGDVITKIDGKTVSAYSDLESALNYCKAGETIEVVIERQEGGTYSEQTLNVTLGKSSVLDKLEQTEETGRNMQRDPYGD